MVRMSASNHTAEEGMQKTDYSSSKERKKNSTDISPESFDSSIEKRMREELVMDDVIPIAPAEIANITYQKNIEVGLGDELFFDQVKKQPKVKWPADPTSFYTLCMIDPDSPSFSLPMYREWLMWLVVNIPGNNVAKGQVLNEYRTDCPKDGIGTHRYVLLVYKQPQKLTFNESHFIEGLEHDRKNFKVIEFAMDYKLGDPVAGNFAMIQHREDD